MSLYQEMGISQEVLTFSEEILAGLKDRFEELDKIAEYNQYKVLHAMQKNRVSAECFAGTTGYGHNDLGRDVLEKVYADVFHTEAALVRPQITCGTHALATALSANLLPGDELLSPVGKPYDTLEEVIGIRESACSLAESASGSPPARSPSTASRTDRSTFWTTGPSTGTASGPRSTRRRNSSPSNGPRATRCGRRSRSSRSANSSSLSKS